MINTHVSPKPAFCVSPECLLIYLCINITTVFNVLDLSLPFCLFSFMCVIN